MQSVAVLSESSDTLAAIATAQSASALVSATATLNESSDTLAAQATAYVAGAVAADITLSESPDAISSTASIGDAATGAWTAWGDSWGDSWGLSWGVFEQPYTELKPNLKLFVRTELHKLFVQFEVEQIIAVAEANNLSVLRAAARPAALYVAQKTHASTFVRTLPSTITSRRKRVIQST